MRGFLGAFFKLPAVKKAVMSDLLRSTFLRTVKVGAKLQGREWLADL
jgi:hypothetical protein